MHEQDHSYLDLSVLPELRNSILSPDAVVLFRKDLLGIIWANANGARLFGGRGVVDLLNAKLSEDQSIVRQLRNIVSQLHKNEPIKRGFRINQGAKSALLQFQIKRVELPENDFAFMVTNLADADDSRNENDLADMAVDALLGFADAAAILDDFGIPISASKEFSDLGPDDNTLFDLIKELRGEDDRLIKRPVPNYAGNIVAVGLARLSDDPSRNLIVLADTAERGENSDVEAKADSIEQSDKQFYYEDEDVAESELFEETYESANDDIPEKRFETEYYNIENTQESSEEEADDNANDEQSPIKITDQESLKQSILEKLNDSRLTELSETDEAEEQADFSDIDADDLISAIDQDASKTKPDNTETSQQEDDELPYVNSQNFLYVDEQDSVRFAWAIDQDGIFKSVSPELARTVGPNAADVVGRSWEDISTVFGIDNSGEIKKLLSKQDTWSSKTVLWPVQGTDMVVPVDLAALPSFDANRQFEGFRGFGIIRTVDAVVDPEATGMALVAATHFNTEESNLDDSSQGESDATLEENELEDEATLEKPTETFSSEEESDKEEASPESHDEPDIVLGTDTNVADDEGSPDNNQNEKTNIVNLVPRSSTSDENSLSEKENSAFKIIGERLKASLPGNKQNNQTEQPSNQHAHLDTSLMENLPVAILVYKTDELLFANQRMLNVSGYETLEELANAGGVDAILNPDVEDINTEARRQYLATKDGKRLPIDPVLHTVPWLGEKALLLSFDTNEEIVLDEPVALQITTSSEIQNILDTASDGIILMENDRKIISINASAEALFGVSYNEAAGNEFETLFAPESQTIVSEYIEALIAPGVESLLNDGRDVIAQETNGGLIPIFLTVSKMEASNKLCAVIRDMTSWKKVEEELIKSRRDAEQISEQKTDFLAHVSHEIRTPLNAIIGFSDVMISEKFGPIDNDRYREYLRDINRSGTHVLELVNDLLDLSKIEAGKLELSFEAVELNQVVAETVALLQPQANSNRIIIRTSLSRAVPKVVADTRSIRQIILNLVSNAIKFSPPNSQVIVSTIYENNGEVAMRVRDTGHGMSKTEIEEALKPFHQLHHVSERAGEGTGLGLPLTKALVEANRALFDIESEPGQGTIAHVQFPTQRVLTD